MLRNFEQLPNNEAVALHGDLDLLVGDYPHAASLLGAGRGDGRMPRWGGEFLVGLGDRDLVVDLRFPGDGYYDERWARGLLQRRRLVHDAFYAPTDPDYLDSLAYHAVVHKRVIANDYCSRLVAMACDLGRDAWCMSPEQMRAALPGLVRDMVIGHGYEFARPRDVSVFFNYHNAGTSLPTVRRKLAGARRLLHARSLVEHS